MLTRKSAATMALAALLTGSMIPLTAGAVGFQGNYDPANWTTGGHDNNSPPAVVDTGLAPVSIAMTNSTTSDGNDPLAGVPGSLSYSIEIPVADDGKFLSFDWDWLSSDFIGFPARPIGNKYDPFSYTYDGATTLLTTPVQDCLNGGVCTNMMSGSVSFQVQSGKTFAFLADTLDNLGGTATTTISKFDVAAPLELSVNSPLEYGNVRIGTSADRTAIATNIGGGDGLTGTYGAASGEYSGGPSDFGPLDSSASDPTGQTYSFAPTLFGDADVSIMVTSNDGGDPVTLALEGTGVGPIADAAPAVDFGVYDPNNPDSALADLLLRNLFDTADCRSGSDCGIDLVGLSIVGWEFADGTLFEFDAGVDPTGDVLGALGEETYRLLFLGATAPGVYTDTLTIFTDEGLPFGTALNPDSARLMVALKATVPSGPPVVPAPAPLALLGIGLGILAWRRR